jgi:hypothetical protein
VEAKEVGDRLERVLMGADGGVDSTVSFRLVVHIGEELIEARAGGEPLAFELGSGQSTRAHQFESSPLGSPVWRIFEPSSKAVHWGVPGFGSSGPCARSARRYPKRPMA